MTLLAMAPGAQATIINPSLMASGNGASSAAMKPSKGITVNCVITPSPMRAGLRSVSRNSPTSSTMPMANMVAAKNHRKLLLNTRNSGGCR